MATSTIIENIRVNNPKVIEEFLKSREESAKSVHLPTAMEKSHVNSDPEQMRDFMRKALSRSEQNSSNY